MSANFGSQQSLPPLKGQSEELESHGMAAMLGIEQLPLSVGQCVNPASQHCLIPNNQPVHLESSSMYTIPVVQHMPTGSSLNRRMVQSTYSITTPGLDSLSHSLIGTQSRLEESSLKSRNIMNNTLRAQQVSSATQQSPRIKLSPNPQDSMFLNMSSHQLLPKNKQPIHREPWPKVISVMPLNIGSQSISPVQRMAPLNQSPRVQKLNIDQSPRFQKSSSGNLSLQKSSSINKRAAPTELSPKVSSESFASIRLKMRESLVASLKLDDDDEQSKLKDKEEDSFSKDTNMSKNQLDKVPDGPSSATKNILSLSSLEGTTGTSVASDLHTQMDNTLQNSTDSYVDVENSKKSIQAINCDIIRSQQNGSSIKDDVMVNESFVTKDDLLLGNGLCWASEIDSERDRTDINYAPKKPKLSHDEVTDLKNQYENPENLSEKIEAELFRLFGGVNKKYKEKGRSLLFNLKDKSNPELRRRVLLGEITPERLCSMSAEELASKELSEWRIAKAEELAQMVVLPDSEVDLRRLVRKTHKGEFQVEVEREDSISVEVTLGTNIYAPIPTKPSRNNMKHEVKADLNESHKFSKSKVRKSKSISKSVLSNTVASVDVNLINNLKNSPQVKSDFIQEIIVEELKDTDSLPPVLSLDEFMKDLDSEPPFENLPLDIGTETTSCDEESSDGSETKLDRTNEHSQTNLAVTESHESPDLGGSKSDPVNISASLENAPDLADGCFKKPLDVVTDTDIKIVSDGDGSKQVVKCTDSDALISNEVSLGEHVWEGLVQLNISSLVTVLGFYKSGEQASTKDWPSFVEIKGRVRLDAFEKFLQELPQSRSRAIMILHFCWKVDSPESGRENLSETINSYILDERVGYAEPAPGVEIYFCPPHTSTTQILLKHLSKEHEETLTSTDNGFVGVVVWRRSSVSPRPSSHPKQGSKKQFASRKQQNSNVNFSVKSPHSHAGKSNPVSGDPTDDAPPGFGPGVSRDEDDLPEFDFTRRSNSNSRSLPPNPSPTPSQPSALPAEEVRHLIHKYGHGQAINSLPIKLESWNDDDDDDDIPEWQPHRDTRPPPPPLLHPVPLSQPQQHLPNAQLQGYQQLQPHLAGQYPVQSQQQPTVFYPSNVVQHQHPQMLSIPMQPQMGFAQPHQVGQQQQQPAQLWAQQQAPGVAGVGVVPPNGLMQMYSYGNQPPVLGGQSYGVPFSNGMPWPHHGS